MSRLRLLRSVLDLALVGLAGILGVIAIKQQLFARSAEGSADRRIANWGDIAQGHELAVASGQVILVEFSDFRCTYCRSFRHTIAALRETFGNKLSIRYRHFPLEGTGSLSWSAAQASECAAEQGRFAAFHDVVFAQQDSIGRKAWSRFALDADLRDTLGFNACVSAERHGAEIQMDLDAAVELGLPGTPSVIINGRLVARTTEASLREHILGEIQRASAE